MKGVFLKRTTLGVLQYVFVKTSFAFLVFAAQMTGNYGEGNFSDFTKLYVYEVTMSPDVLARPPGISGRCVPAMSKNLLV